MSAAEGATPTDRPRRVSKGSRSAAALGFLFVSFLAISVARRHRARPPAPVAAPLAPSAAPSTSDAIAQLDSAIAELKRLPVVDPSANTQKLLAALEEISPGTASTVGFVMPDGSAPPRLPSDAPRSVELGVVLVRYRGAQLAGDEAPSRDEALVVATRLAKIAQSDFAMAVKQGDVGSAESVGVVRRGVLEPAIEYRLFTLPIGWVSELVDTPRGFWVMKRVR